MPFQCLIQSLFIIVMAEQISRLFPNKKERRHEGGHYVPSKKDIYRDFVIEMFSKYKNLSN